MILKWGKNMKLRFPYGKEKLNIDLPDERINGVLVSNLHSYKAEKDGLALVEDALNNPIGTPKLFELSKGKRNIVLIASDHTRPVPSKVIVPPMLNEIRKGNPNADITILIATGCHRTTSREEIVAKLGEEVANNEKIVIHDCDNSPLVKIGTLPSGGECIINKMVVDADLVVAEGFIEPHFFAGYSGSRKSILPGVASRTTVLANHCSEFIAHPCSRTGILEGNLIHEDMVWAARKAKLAFIVNVVIDENKDTIFAVAGDTVKAHKVGCEFLASLCKVEAIPSDIVISTNGGYPLDQNIYQAVKGMTAAEATVKEGGVIIMLAKSNDGHGGEGFYHRMADESDIQKTLKLFLNRGRNETEPNQWQTQIFIRILLKATVIYMSDASDKMVERLHMIPAHSLEEALAKAEKIIGKADAGITAIPDGVGVMVVENRPTKDYHKYKCGSKTVAP
jgi:nickel-dependent lactate racemase